MSCGPDLCLFYTLSCCLQVGATIKEKLIAEAVSWYTGEAIEDEPYFFGGDDDEE